MNGKGEIQKELFDEFTEQMRPRKRPPATAGIKRIYTIAFSIEQLVFACIGLIILFVICFSLGVEKGKRALVPAREEHVAAGIKQKEPEPVEKAVEKPAQAKASATTGGKNSPYAIQLAAYGDNKRARREMAALEKNGNMAEVKISGKYSVVYVVGFKTWKEADAALPAFRSRYEGCFIKRR